MANFAPWRTHDLMVKELLKTSRDHTFILYCTLSRMLSHGAGLHQLSPTISLAVDPTVLFVKETDGRMKTDLL